MSPRALLAAWAVACIPAAAGADPFAFHHEDPYGLNEAALRRLLAGDEHAARIYLERAAVLAPDDATIAANLATLRKALATPGPRSWSVVAPTGSAPPAAPQAAVPVPAAPPAPAIWPPR